MTEKNLSKQPENSLPSEATRSREHFVTPAVDIFETEQGLTLVADVPGLDREHLRIDIDKGILTLEGRIPEWQGSQEIYREFTMPSYYRQFQLPDTVDLAKISAEIQNGVLTLKLPKAEAAKPRRIEVRSLN